MRENRVLIPRDKRFYRDREFCFFGREERGDTFPGSFDPHGIERKLRTGFSNKLGLEGSLKVMIFSFAVQPVLNRGTVAWFTPFWN